MHKFAVCVAFLAAGCASVPPAATELAVVQRVEHLDAVAREPMLAEHPQGALFVTGYFDPEPRLWKSQDRGATWTRVDVGREAVGNSDVDLAVAADGTLYFVNMTYDREKNEGRQIAIGVSGDAGTSWRWTTLSKTRFDDSDDLGATWTTRTVADTGAPAFFPYLTARRRGELAATWFTSTKNDMKDLQWYAARIDGERVLVSEAQSLESRRSRDGGNDTAGEYLAIAFLRDGTLGVVTPLQNVAEKRAGFTWWRFHER